MENLDNVLEKNQSLSDNPTPSERYLYKPFTGSSHLWATHHALKLPTDTPVLDIGSGSGAIGKTLKENGFTALSAVEIDEEARRLTSDIYSRMEPTIAPFRERRFGLILLLDILEHLTDPFEFLADVSSLLHKDGMILISVPNVAHWSVRFSLLFGFFEYTNRGILDRTHYQFFNRRRFRELTESLKDFDLIDMNSSLEPAEFVLPQAIWDNPLWEVLSQVRLAAARTLPGMFAYQHLAALKKF